MRSQKIRKEFCIFYKIYIKVFRMSEIINKGSGSSSGSNITSGKSNATSFNGAIVIYQHGLGGNEQDLCESIRSLVVSNTYRNIAFGGFEKLNESFINMDNYDAAKNAFTSESAKNEVNTMLTELVEFAKNNSNKNVHIRTRLGGKDQYDSIEDQVERLAYIIKYIADTKKCDKKIVLVGHSQGGLVNLKTAIKLEGYIDQIISLSTPYNASDVGSSLLTLYNVVSKFGAKDIANSLVNGNSAVIDKLKARATTLTDYKYFKQLKEDWKKASNKPKLHVISGTSGIYSKVVPDIDFLGNPTISVSSDSFDGIVTTYEQHDIEYTTYQPLVKLDLPCLTREPGLLDSRGDYKGNCGSCLSCDLPRISLQNTALGVVIDGVVNWFKTGKFDTTEKLAEIGRALSAGLNRENYEGEFEDLYKILKSEFSHTWIRYNSLALYSIRSHIE